MPISVKKSAADGFPNDHLLTQAIILHQAGSLHDAEQLYRAFLKEVPQHPDANYNLGKLALQMNRSALAVHHFKKALENSPAQQQYWLGFIEALMLSGQAETARHLLRQAYGLGLRGEAIEALLARLEARATPAAPPLPDDGTNTPEVLRIVKEKARKSGKRGRRTGNKSRPAHTSSAVPAAEEVARLGLLFNQGRSAEAEALARRLTQRFPADGFAWKVLGAVLSAQGRHEEAVAPKKKAAALVPEDAEALVNLGNTFNMLGRLAEAEDCFRRALALKPDYATAYFSFGNTLNHLGRMVEAEASYRRALELKPDYADAHYNLGAVLNDQQRFVEAENCFRRALAINPDSAEGYLNLGITLKGQGRLKEAEDCFRRALEIRPEYAEAHYNLANTLKELGRLHDAVDSYGRAIALRPDYADAHSNLGNSLWVLKRLEEAEASFRRALTIRPEFAEAHSNLGNVLHVLKRLEEAEACYRRALAIRPDFAEAHNNLGSTLKDLGCREESEAHYRRALALRPDYAEAHSNLFFSLNYAACLSPEYLLEQAREWEYGCVPAAARADARERRFERTPLAGRRLRVGYVSGDFRHHAVSYFVEQLFSHHDRTRVEIYAYSTYDMRDAATERLESLVDHWASVAALSDRQLYERIAADRIDVLVDLSGHTGHNRLGLFALRAAPVQTHWLGYFATTGLTEMDYWIGDAIITPRETDHHFSETVWRLPRTWISYNGKDEAPASCWQPAPDGTVWLGSFNNLGKLTPATLSLWACLLHKLPEARLLLKTKELTEERNRQRILGFFAEAGIGPERIELRDRNVTPDWKAHMAYYDRLDIALDPVGGVGGGTTTCDALWMGVPVVSLVGDRMGSRMTASMLAAIGRPEWLAADEEEYVSRVVALARDVAGRRTLRGEQRATMDASPLCDAHGLTRALEDAYRGMFDSWERARQLRD